jgi:peptidoglycan/xylan/chitin deacetylase (PgdA/CDA1 family)
MIPRIFFRVLIIVTIFLTGCSSIFSVGEQTQTINGQKTPQRTENGNGDGTEPALLVQSLTPSKTPFLPLATFTPTETFTPLPTNTPTPIPTSTWAINPAGKVIAPILLYHHISDKNPGNRYYLSLDTFESQLKLLQDWGYTVIPISTLVTALTDGGQLPDRPVVISFDDGNLDIYQNAFPIMKKYGDVGAFFIIAGILGAKDYVTVDEIIEMAAAGWEIGSHSMTHIDLTKNHGQLNYQVADSKIKLENVLNVKITTFAYPFGTIDPQVANTVAGSGYLAAVGLGTSTTHTLGTLYYLSREEVRSEYDTKAFEALLPWQGTP